MLQNVNKIDRLFPLFIPVVNKALAANILHLSLPSVITTAPVVFLLYHIRIFRSSTSASVVMADKLRRKTLYTKLVFVVMSRSSSTKVLCALTT